MNTERTDVSSWRLSPAFDLNPDPDPGPKYLSTDINEGDNTASVDLVLDVAEYFRLTASQAAGVLGEIVDAVSQWKTVAARHGLSTTEIDGMQRAFNTLDEVDL